MTRAMILLFCGVLTYFACIGEACPTNCSCETHPATTIRCDSRNLRFPPKDLPRKLYRLDLDHNPNLRIPLHYFNGISINVLSVKDCGISDYFHLPKDIESLILGNNKLNTSTLRLFLSEKLSSLHTLELQQNEIRILDTKESIFNTTKSLIKLDLAMNRIPVLSETLFAGLSQLRYLFLNSCDIQDIHPRAFQDLQSLAELYMSNNRMRHLPEMLFTNTGINAIDISSNDFHDFPSIKGPTYLRYLDASNNKIRDISRIKYTSIRRLNSLILNRNLIQSIPPAINEIEILFSLDLALNEIRSLEKNTFNKNHTMLILNLGNNHISFIHPDALRGPKSLTSIYLNTNHITTLPNEIFRGHKLYTILLHDNPISNLDRPFQGQTVASLITLHGTNITDLTSRMVEDFSPSTQLSLSCDKLHFIQTTIFQKFKILCSPSFQVDLEKIDYTLAKSLLFGGFECEYSRWYYGSSKCTACKAGYYNNGNQKCRACPRGGYYQDQIAQSSCKKCNPGQFVYNGAGNSSLNCQTCPAGIDPNRYAHTRACYCLPNYGRRGRFQPCKRCNASGIVCANGTEHLSAGYFWKWTNRTQLDQFLCFKKNLANEGEDYNTSCNSYTGKLPPVYRCPYKNACLGGMSARCQNNYTGPLCAVCNTHYYRTYLGCLKCPSITASILKLLAAPFIIILVVLVLRWMETKVVENDTQRTLADFCLSIIKILLGYYQILAVIIRLLSNIEWPQIMVDFSISFYQVVLEVFRLPTLRCINPKLEISAYGEMVASCSIMIGIPILFFLAYCLHSCRSKKEMNRMFVSDKVRLQRLYLRGVLMLYFVLYPSVCQRIFQVMPFNCLKFCFDQDGHFCQSYLRVDFNVQCPSTTPSNNRYVFIGYAALVIPIGFPVLLLALLWYSHRQLKNGNQFSNNDNVVVYATRFCYENYKSSYWYWEVLEMMRKLLFAVGFACFGLGTRTNLGYMIIISGIATIWYAYVKPIKHKTEHEFHMISLSCLLVTLCVSTLLGIMPEYIRSIHDPKSDKLGLTLILLFVNLAPPLFVLVCIASRIYRRLCKRRL